jgi:hypothetical protein
LEENEIVEWHDLPGGERILTGISTFCNEGNHGECPGSGISEEYDGKTVFCICPCHELPAEA